jgi:hypothetical protein
MRGYRMCEFCERQPGETLWPPTSARDESGEFFLGNAEIRVPGANGVTYAAPNMLIHYVTEHGYRPPEEFLEALQALESRP